VYLKYSSFSSVIIRQEPFLLSPLFLFIFIFILFYTNKREPSRGASAAAEAIQLDALLSYKDVA
jgi:hypothetical protein